ncbi:hypothetical protein NE237_005997 [Protea cynaroides]|uniref:Thioredoxin domain-containing protein n=1 Tax=Protea cynaroides TaxID=273540 RepID=A0A9Q0QUW7_9MAGN|nr:hypothetical protein NE237_005997 [Protea cynaroides]
MTSYDRPCFRKWRLLALAFFVLLCSVDFVVALSNRNHSLEWQILTWRNYSSQIRLHPRIILFVTVPWSGEARSLMKELSNLSAYKKERVHLPKLMVIYRNTDKVLADILGATKETTVFCYHYSVSYKYQGRLRVHNILSSFDHLVSLQPEDLLLKTLNTAGDLKAFLGSTDKSVLLLEFCGWSAKLLAKGSNRNESSFHVQDATENGVILGTHLHGETSTTLPSKGKINEKGLRNEKLTCEVKNGPNGIPWLERFSLANDSAPPLDSEFMTSGAGISCTFDEFQQFESFFSKFTTTAREFFLPPERQRFGLVSDRALLSTLGVSGSDSYSWLVMLYYAGCPSCTETLKRGEDLSRVLQMHHSPAIELEGEGHDLEPALPMDKPSVILFVDRSSESLDIRQKSLDALITFREIALQNELFHQRAGQHSLNFRAYSSIPSKGVSRSLSNPIGNERGEFSTATQMVKFKDKMAVMIINEDGKVALNNIAAGEQFQSVNDILGHLLQPKKEAKLSILAKELGFQLLSDDFEVKQVDLLPTQTETAQSVEVEVPSEIPKEEIVESAIYPGKYDLPDTASTTAVQREELAGVTFVRPSPYQKEMGGYVEEGSQFISVKLDRALMTGENSIPKVMSLEEESSVQIGQQVGQKIEHQKFRGCFFFSDGGYQLLRALSGGSEIPSMLILDPISQKHYIFPEEVFSYSSLVNFLDGFSNGSLNSYKHSETIIKSPREPIHPPFLNLDFHEVDSIPRVTALTFSELVQGYNQLDSQNVGHAWMKDVLVLFSNSWCGFCQRAELVIREVYRALKGYVNVLQNGPRNGESRHIHITGKSKDAILNELPQIFLMDCTLNDCNSLLESMGQKELYPTLVLFPAGKKNAIFYKGDMVVTNVIKFVADHGSNSFISEVIMWNGAEKRVVSSYLSKNESPIPVDENDPFVKRNYHEITFNDMTPAEILENNQVGSYTSEDPYKASPHVLVGSVLTATDMLLSAPPFDKSVVLIVKADRSTGFQGLIINKHISWDTLQELNDGLELLKKAPLSFGGPVLAEGMPLVSLSRVVTKPGYPEVLPSVYFLDQLATIKAVEGLNSGNQTVEDYWFFFGCSGWAWNQLFYEIAEGAWHVNNEHGQLDWPQR